MFVQGSSTRPLGLQGHQSHLEWLEAPLLPASPSCADHYMYLNQYQHYLPLDAMGNHLQYPSSPSQASSDLCSVPELDYSASPPSSASITDVDPSEHPSFNDVSNNSYLLPLHAPRPLPYSSPTLLQFDLPDVDEDLSFPPYTTPHKKRRFRRDDDLSTSDMNMHANTSTLADIASSSHSAVTASSSVPPAKRRKFHSDASLNGKSHRGQPFFRREPHLSFTPHGTLLPLSVHAAHHQASASQY